MFNFSTFYLWIDSNKILTKYLRRKDLPYKLKHGVENLMYLVQIKIVYYVRPDWDRQVVEWASSNRVTSLLPTVNNAMLFLLRVNWYSHSPSVGDAVTTQKRFTKRWAYCYSIKKHQLVVVLAWWLNSATNKKPNVSSIL